MPPLHLLPVSGAPRISTLAVVVRVLVALVTLFQALAFQARVLATLDSLQAEQEQVSHAGAAPTSMSQPSPRPVACLVLKARRRRPEMRPLALPRAVSVALALAAHSRAYTAIQVAFPSST